MAEIRTGARRSLASTEAAFELRLQLGSPVFAIVLAISALMLVASLTIQRIEVGPLRGAARTSVEAVLYLHLVWSLFHLFTSAAFATESASRDRRTGFAPLVVATPAPAGELNLGRLGGSLAATLLAYLSVPAAVAVAPLLPWAGGLAAPAPAALVYGTCVFALPNLCLAAAIFFALARTTGAALAPYLGAVALLVLYGLGSGGPATSRPDLAAALLDPFGFAAYRLATL
ncbi:MAG: hypothetical protein JO048_16010, partial [Methylobacteriaceae bacterium]|nr:hypothetical protein [Methylobacteriaceae bacterium]